MKGNEREAIGPDLNDQKKSSTKKTVFFTLGIVAALVLVIGVAFGIGYTTTPFQAKNDVNKVYLIKGQDAKGQLEFLNNANSAKTLEVDFGSYGVEKQIIQANAEGNIEYDFGKIEDDTLIKGKYGFMNMKNIEVDVIVVDESQFTIDKSNIQIYQDKTNITNKKYVEPNKEITIEVTISNDSKKEFEREYALKIDGKTIANETAKWNHGDDKTTISYDYKFTKQGYHKINIGDTTIDFLCSTKDKVPSNGTILKRTSGGYGVLELTNKYDRDIIVVLAKPGDKKATAKVFIKANKKATIRGIKDGTYIIYTKGGLGYSKVIKDFLEVDLSYKSDDKLKFKTTSGSYTIWKVTLGVYDGNMDISLVDDDAIPA